MLRIKLTSELIKKNVNIENLYLKSIIKHKT